VADGMASGRPLKILIKNFIIHLFKTQFIELENVLKKKKINKNE
jgi:hypothetical protein